MRQIGGYYILSPTKEVIHTNDVVEWGEFFESKDRIVEKTEMDGVVISTVFIGIDHGWGEPRPVVFETMIFGGANDNYQERYSTWDEAVAGHARAVDIVHREQLGLKDE